MWARMHCSDGRTTMELVVAEVVLVHVSKAVTAASPTGKLVVDPIKYAPVARLGGVSYGVCTSLFDIPRPDKEGRYPARTT